MRIKNTFMNSLSMIGFISATILVTTSISANAACAISQGNGTAQSQAKAVSLAKRDARSKIGQNVASNASYSKPICSVADNFQAGIATYRCSVDLSFCTTPKVQQPVSHKPKHNNKFFRNSTRHNFNYSNFKYHNFSISRRAKFQSHAFGRFHIGVGRHYSWRTQSCVRFNAYAQGRSFQQAKFLVGDALNQSLFDHIGHGLNSRAVYSWAPSCSNNGYGVINCTMSARYCD